MKFYVTKCRKRWGKMRIFKSEGSRSFCSELLLVFCSCLTGLGILCLATGGYSGQVFWCYISMPKLVVLNVLPVVVFSGLFYVLIGKAWVAIAVGGSISVVMALCNYFKLVFRDDPLYFEDITLIREAINMSESYSLFVDWKIVVAVGSVVLSTIMLYILTGKETAGWKRRCVVLGVIVFTGGLAWPVYKDESVYAQFENYEQLDTRSATQLYVSRGFFYPFVHSMFLYKEVEPWGYDEAELELLLSQYDEVDIPSGQKVNIIAVMREAYADFSKYDIPDFDNSSYDLYHQLQDESYTGELFVNAFGGGTVDTERCFLTGDYVLKDFRGKTNSYVWYLKDQGYVTEGSHPFFQWFYNRRNINEFLGFSNYRFYEDTYGAMTERYFPEDSYMYEQVYQDFIANKASGNSYFSFSVTVQSHGPYPTGYRVGERQYLTGSQYSDECRTAMDNYMEVITEGDTQLLQFIHKLEVEEDPVVFVLFSDHLPWMGDGNVYYAEMGIDFSTSSEEIVRQQHTTEYLLWANNAAKKVLGNDFVGEGPTISPCYLMNILFEQCSWDGPAYMQVMDEQQKVFPVASTVGKYVVDDVFTCEIPEERKELFSQFVCLQYYWRNKFRY